MDSIKKAIGIALRAPHGGSGDHYDSKNSDYEIDLAYKLSDMYLQNKFDVKRIARDRFAFYNFNNFNFRLYAIK